MAALRWGVMGTARIATEKVVPALGHARDCEVVAITSRDPGTAREAASRLGIPRDHGTYADLLADAEVDAVYIPLPNHLHGEWAIAAARAGKHVLCEKPLALTSADAQRMVDEAHAAGVTFMEAFMYRLHPSWERARDLVASGRIGALQAVHTWFSYYNDDPANIRNIAEAGGGALLDLGCYGVNVARMLFGAEPSDVEGAMITEPALGVDTTTSAVLCFDDDGVATLTCSTRAKPDQYVTIHGTEGRIHVELPFNIPPDRPTRVHLSTGKGLPALETPETFEFAGVSPYTVQGERFARAVLDGTGVPIPAGDGVANMRVLERIVAAAQ
ncbi:Gfo/Idh/MocA family oxidoreductase [Egibacter rhizosphaerae]|uniref:Gfo/Idh/MocA family oxidoreductase n=1 Tax=Egibacter rhizosphaerae TaxID=1670831 RepID=A0A411YEB6_9ACTN|nr:Gfo/Idh/MocA family oxidoreductase [Egibacter rhizosphaerae]QBI19548.1 Gfo/Idh/MocA family oxidoreductase [Egibacter rhizosphaerae]